MIKPWWFTKFNNTFSWQPVLLDRFTVTENLIIMLPETTFIQHYNPGLIYRQHCQWNVNTANDSFFFLPNGSMNTAGILLTRKLSTRQFWLFLGFTVFHKLFKDSFVSHFFLSTFFTALWLVPNLQMQLADMMPFTVLGWIMLKYMEIVCQLLRQF